MKKNITTLKFLRNTVVVAAAALLAMGMANCERRDLWVYGDEFDQVLLNIDWRNYMRDKQLYPYSPDPAGMTVWIFPMDGEATGRRSYRTTTTEVRHFETYLSAGDYRAVTIDYSPEEYGHQQFVNMEWVNTAKVEAVKHSYSDEMSEGEVHLFGPKSYGGTPAITETGPTGLYQISYDPEDMASDTTDMTINSGKYDDYIPYEEYEEYQETLKKQEFDVMPLIVPWRMRIRVYVRGIYYLYNMKGSIAGLADGFMLGLNHTSDQPCIQYLDNWEAKVTGDNVGYVALTFKTWGLRNSMWPDMSQDHTKSAGTAKDLRLNLKFVLRDRKTELFYHYDVGDLVRIYNNEYALRIDLEDGFVGTCDGEPVPQPDLPYAEPVNGAGFDGIVVPWEDEKPANITF